MEIVVGDVSDIGNVKGINQDNFVIKIYEHSTGLYSKLRRKFHI